MHIISKNSWSTNTTSFPTHPSQLYIFTTIALLLFYTYCWFKLLKWVQWWKIWTEVKVQILTTSFLKHIICCKSSLFTILLTWLRNLLLLCPCYFKIKLLYSNCLKGLLLIYLTCRFRTNWTNISWVFLLVILRILEIYWFINNFGSILIANIIIYIRLILNQAHLILQFWNDLFSLI